MAELSALVLVQILVFSSFTNGARILMSSPQIESHIREQLAFGEELRKHGHEIYVALGSPYPKMESIKERGFGIVTYNIPIGCFVSSRRKMGADSLGNAIFNESMTIERRMLRLSQLMSTEIAPT